MTAFLVILVIILFGISVWQMNRIFQLAKVKPSTDSEIASDKDNNMQRLFDDGLSRLYVYFDYCHFLALGRCSFARIRIGAWI